MGFAQSAHDSALVTMHTKAGSVYLLLYVDDMIITSNNETIIHNLKHSLHQQFEMKVLGYLRYFLGIEVAYSPKGYLLSQTKYCNDVIQRAGFPIQRQFQHLQNLI